MGSPECEAESVIVDCIEGPSLALLAQRSASVNHQNSETQCLTPPPASPASCLPARTAGRCISPPGRASRPARTSSCCRSATMISTRRPRPSRPASPRCAAAITTTRSFPAFRACARPWRRSRRAPPASPPRAAQVIATPGGQSALYAAVQGVLDPGDHAIVVAPYYATYPGTFRAAGADFTVVEAAAEDGFQPRAEAIEKALTPKTRAILLNTPNNPTGAVYSRAALEGDRRALPPPRSLAALRRGLLDAGRRRARLAARAGRHGRAHAGHQLDVEEPRHDRLAHRLADRPGRRSSRC